MTSRPLQTYSEALEYLFGFINWEVERHQRYAEEAMTLARPRQVLAACGNPHLQYPVIHVTGTKGKGSVGAMCASALRASGLRTGLYSSPHLQDYRERFRVDNALISPDDFTALVNELRPAAESVADITWFEVTTALAFLYFARQNVDIAVIEVGLGGRLDATNVVHPVVSVITSLSYDHTHLLGDSLASIAREKGGIIKKGVPVVSAPQPSEGLAVLEEIAAEREASLTLVGRDWLYTPQQNNGGESFLAGPVGEAMQPYQTRLLGEHQVLNATVALATLDQARQAGIAVTTDGVRTGLAQVDWPGRLEVIHGEPVVVLDAAHNAASARRLQAALEERFPQCPLALIFGAFVDKDITGMFDALLPLADFLVVTQSAHPRALAPHAVGALALEHGYAGPVYQAPDVRTAIQRAAELVGPLGLICATGSLSVVGEARSAFNLPVGHISPQPVPLSSATSDS
jgi:dihydrofolate synthase / folylpolyglutamate synthase